MSKLEKKPRSGRAGIALESKKGGSPSSVYGERVKTHQNRYKRPAKKIHCSERVIQKSILDFMRRAGVLAWRMPLGARMVRRYGSDEVFHAKNQLAGFPDIFGILRRQHRGVMFAFEIKTAEGIVEPHQADWHELLARSGCKVAVVRSLTQAIAYLTVWGEVKSD